MIEINRHQRLALTANTGELAAAFSTMALISSLLVSRLAVKVRSTSETLITGTRTARPSNLPASSGKHQAHRCCSAGFGRNHGVSSTARPVGVGVINIR